MSPETAEQVVELALQSTSPSITFELQGQGGEPLLNFDVLRHLVEFAQTRNKRTAGKTLSFRLLSNFTAMTEEAAEWLIANDVLVSTTTRRPGERARLEPHVEGRQRARRRGALDRATSTAATPSSAATRAVARRCAADRRRGGPSRRGARSSTST